MSIHKIILMEMLPTILKGVFAFIVLIVVVVGIYLGYKYLTKESAENWCVNNNKTGDGYDVTKRRGIFDVVVTKRNGSEPAVVTDSITGTKCDLNICTPYAEELYITLKDIDFDLKNATNSEIDARCTNVCASWTSLINCRCNNCTVCNDDCGLGYLERCQKYLTCGTSEHKTFDGMSR